MFLLEVGYAHLGADGLHFDVAENQKVCDCDITDLGIVLLYLWCSGYWNRTSLWSHIVQYAS